MRGVSHSKRVRMAVTGATGLVGQAVVELAAARGHKVIALGRNRKKAERANWPASVRFLSCDIYSEPSMAINAIGAFGADRIIHLAWASLPDYRNPENFSVDLAGSIRFFENLFEQLHGQITQVLAVGTCLEFGINVSGPLEANHPVAPHLPYPAAKEALRQYLLAQSTAQPNLSTQWLRLFYLWGAGQGQNTLYGQLLHAISNDQTSFDMSKGEQLRDYLPLSGVAARILALAERPDMSGTYHCCSGIPVSVRRFVEERLKEHKKDITLNLGVYPYPSYEPMAFWGNPGPMEEILRSFND